MLNQMFKPLPLVFPKIKPTRPNLKLRASMMNFLLGTKPSGIGGAIVYNVTTGGYVGDGAALKAIAGLGFQPKFLIIYMAGWGTVAHKSDQDGTKAYAWYDAGPDWEWQDDIIVSLDAGGFTVGDSTPVGDNLVNGLGEGYNYVAFRSGNIRFKNGTYVGNGAASQAIAGVGFRPKFLIIMATDIATNTVGYKSDQDATESLWYWQAGPNYRYEDDMIISLDADGFTVGDGTGFGNEFNVGASDYYYLAW